MYLACQIRRTQCSPTAPFDGVVANLFAKQFNTASTSMFSVPLSIPAHWKPEASQFWKRTAAYQKQAIV